MKPLFHIVVTICLVLAINAHPENIEEVRELPQSKEPLVEAEETEPQARLERCTACSANLKLNIKSPKDILAEIQQLPGEVHTQESFEGCSSDKGCAGIKVKDGRVIEKFGNLESFKEAAAQNTGNEFTFHEAGADSNLPFWWMNKNSPFKSSGAFEKFSKSSSYRTASSGAGTLENPAVQSSSFKSSYTSSTNGGLDLSSNPFFNGAAFGTGQSTFGNGQSTFGTGQSSIGNGQSSFGAGQSSFGTGQSSFGTGQSAFGTGQSTIGNGQSAFDQFSGQSAFNSANFGQGSGFVGSSPRPFTASTAGSSVFENEYQSTGSGISSQNIGNSRQTCAGEGYTCVPRSQCNNGEVNTNGVNVLQASAQKQYCNLQNEICCRIVTSGLTGAGNFQGSFDASSVNQGLDIFSTGSGQNPGSQGSSSFGSGFDSINRESNSFGSKGTFGSSSNSFGSGVSLNRGSSIDAFGASRGNKYGSTGIGSVGSTVAPTTPLFGSTNFRNDISKSTGQSNFIETDSFSAGSESSGAFGPGQPYLPPVSSTNFPSPTTPATFVTTPTPTFTPRPITPRPFITAKPTYLPPTPSTSAPGYLPPYHTGEASNTRETLVPTPGPNYNEGHLYLDVLQQPSLRPSIRPVAPPLAPSEIPAGCAAALKCTAIEYCTAEGVISTTPVVLTREQASYRVPLTDCKDLESGLIGKCCRDPTYTDPWPTNQLGKWVPGVFGGDDGRYVPDNRGSPSTNDRPQVSVRPTDRPGFVTENAFLTTPKPTSPTFGTNEITPGYPSSTVTPIVQKNQYEFTGQGQYSKNSGGVIGQTGFGRVGIGQTGQVSQNGVGQVTQSGIGQETRFGVGQIGQIGVGSIQRKQTGQFTGGQRTQFGVDQTGQRGVGFIGTAQKENNGQFGIGQRKQTGFGITATTQRGQGEQSGFGQSTQFGIGQGTQYGIGQGTEIGVGQTVTSGGGVISTGQRDQFGIGQVGTIQLNRGTQFGKGTQTTQSQGPGFLQGGGQGVLQEFGTLQGQGVGQVTRFGQGVRQGVGQQGTVPQFEVGQYGQGQVSQNAFENSGINTGVRTGEGQLTGQEFGVTQGVSQGFNNGASQGQYDQSGSQSVLNQGGRFGFGFEQGGGSRFTGGQGTGGNIGFGKNVRYQTGQQIVSGRGQALVQGEGQTVVQGKGEIIKQGEGQIVSQGKGQIVTQELGQGIKQGGGQYTIQGTVSQSETEAAKQGSGATTTQGQGQAVTIGKGETVRQGGGFIVTQEQGQIVKQGGGVIVTQEKGQGIKQGEGQIVTQGGGQYVTQGGGQYVKQGGGVIVTQGIGQSTKQGEGQIIAQGEGQIVTQGGGQYVTQGGGQYVKQGAGVIVTQGIGQSIKQGEGQTIAQGEGQIVTQGGGQYVTQGGGQYVKQGGGAISTQGKGQGQIVTQGEGQIVSQGEGQIVTQGGGQIVTQGGGQYVTQGGGQYVKQGGGVIITQGKGQGQIVTQGEGQLVSQGDGQIVTQGGGQYVTQGGGQYVKQGQGQYTTQGVGQAVLQDFGTDVKQGNGYLVSQGGGYGVENEYGASTQRVFLQKYTGNGQCGVLNPQRPYGNRNDLEVDFAEIPWQAMVLLQTNRSLLCGGVITRPEVVVTSASCVDGLDAKNVLIKGGEWKLGIDDEPLPFQIVQVKTILRHPEYRRGSLKYDVAILVLTENLRFAQNIQPICLPTADDTLDAFYNGAGQSIVTGWGKVVLQAHLSGSIMHSINMSLINPDQCEAKLSHDYPQLLEQYDEDSCVCGQPSNPLNSICKVDIGSALACTTGDNHFVLRGIYSWDSGCQIGNQIAVFYKFDIEWYEWAIGLIESVRFTKYTIGTKVTQSKITTVKTTRISSGVKGSVSGIKGVVTGVGGTGTKEFGQFPQGGSGTKEFGTFLQGGSGTAEFGQFSQRGSGVKGFGQIAQGEISTGGIKGVENIGQGAGFTDQFTKFTEVKAGDSGLNFGSQIKGPISKTYTTTYTEKKIFQSEPKIITYTTKPKIVTYTTKPEIFTYTTKPEIVTYTTKPKIVTYTTKPEIVTYTTKPEIVTYTTKPKIFTYTTKPEIVTYTTKPEIVTYTTKPKIFTYTTKPKIVSYTTKPQFITYETSGSGTNPQYVAPGVTINPSFSDIVGKHKHDNQCQCLEGKK